MSGVYEKLPIFAQNLACTLAGWQRGRARFTPVFYRMLEERERTVQGPLAVLHSIQRQRLDALVRRAREHVPFYRELAPPSDTKDDQEAIARTLATIPPLEKSVYRDHVESFVARDLPRDRLLRGKTSGTTGTALPLWYTAETLAEEYATVWRMRRAAGVRLEDRHLTFGAQIVVPFAQKNPPFWRTNYHGNQTLFSIYHISPENLHAYVDAIHASPARYIQGYPSALYLLAHALLDAGRPLPKRRLTAVFTSSESLLAFHRGVIERAFQAPVYDRYGASEFAVSLTACPAERLHVDMEFCIVEVEPEEETQEYVRGSLLVTGLANDATPFLRYRIGDIATRLKKPCLCGRPGDVFLDVDGRIEDLVETPDGRLIGRLDHIFKQQLDIAEAQILQKSNKAIEVLVVPRLSYGAHSEHVLRKEIRSRLGDAIRADIRLVDAIAREPNGKLRAVKSWVGGKTL
jgi:phenylacetate-CoA ligase